MRTCHFQGKEDDDAAEEAVPVKKAGKVFKTNIFTVPDLTNS
jgi:hypothetical protein